VVAEGDLADPRDESTEPRDSDLSHLRGEGLTRFVALDGRERAMTLTERGHHLLETHRRDREDAREQAFYAGVNRPRELSPDVQLYRAYNGEQFGPDAHVFGNEVGERLTSSRYLKPSKLALHTTIPRIDAQRRESGEAAQWERDLAQLRKNLPQSPQKGRTLIELFVCVTSEKPQPHLASIVWALSSVG
jgi:hypothetical protein